MAGPLPEKPSALMCGGLGAQEREVRRFVEYKGWTLVDLYREEGVSGYKKDRPAMDRLLADAKAGRFDVAVFPSIDRALRAAGVDTSAPTGELLRNIMASLAEFEGRVIYERLSKGKRRKAAEGGYTGVPRHEDLLLTTCHPHRNLPAP